MTNKEIRKEKKRIKIEREVILLAHKYKRGQTFFEYNGDSQRFWKLVKKINYVH